MNRDLSLKSQLRLWVLGLLTVVGLMTAATSYWYTRDEMESFLDHQLRQFAVNLGPAGQGASTITDDPVPHDIEDDLNVQVWDGAGNALRSSVPENDIARQPVTGFADTKTQSVGWRTYTVVTAKQTVQVSQQLAVRQELEQDAALRALIPIGIIIPLAWLLLGVVINRVLGSLDSVVVRLAQQTPGKPAQIPASEVPAEIRPMVRAMNDLLQRLQQALVAQKQFMADAAHELRTPITALQLQIANLHHGESAGSSDTRMKDLDSGIRRASSLINQLLKVARYQSDDIKKDLKPVDLVVLVKTIIGEVVPIADHRGLDLGLVRADAAIVLGDPEDLRVMVGNFVENAIRYTPDGGIIDVAITTAEGSPVIEIKDTGPGIAPEKLERVFEPFYRAAAPGVEGSGLGLSIASRIAERYGIKIELMNRSDRSGIVARIIFARTDSANPS